MADWLVGDEHTIPELLGQRLSDDPDGEYLDIAGTAFTGRAIAHAGWRLANAFADLGLEPGARVASLIENSPEAMLFWWGAVLGGGIAVPVNTAYKGDYLRHQLADSGSAMVVVQADLADRIATVAAELPDLRHVIVIGTADDDLRAQLSDGGRLGVHDWGDLLGAAADEPHVTIRPSDLGTFIYTGGTT